MVMVPIDVTNPFGMADFYSIHFYLLEICIISAATMKSKSKKCVKDFLKKKLRVKIVESSN